METQIRESQKLTYLACLKHLLTLPLYSADKLKDWILVSVTSSLLDATNVENVFFLPERELLLGPVGVYTLGKMEEIEAVLKDAAAELKNEFAEIVLEPVVENRGYVYGQGEISVRVVLKFKREKRDAILLDRENKKLSQVLEEVPTQLTAASASVPTVLEEVPSHQTRPEESGAQ